MKLVIQTQHRENYAAHNSDYVHGKDAPYWKYKGGDTYVVEGVSIEDAQSEGFYELVFSLIEEKNEAYEEYVLGSDLIDTCDFDITNHVQPWETPIMIKFDGVQFHATKTSVNGEYGYMRPEIAQKVETWVMSNSTTGRDSYESKLHLMDGSSMSYDEFSKYLDEVAA